CCPPAATGEHKQYGVLLADGVTRKSSFATLLRVDAAANPPSGSQGPRPTSAPVSVHPAVTPTPHPTPTVSSSPPASAPRITSVSSGSNTGGSRPHSGPQGPLGSLLGSGPVAGLLGGSGGGAWIRAIALLALVCLIGVAVVAAVLIRRSRFGVQPPSESVPASDDPTRTTSG
ncbi:MAG: hypothetical protein ACRENM_00635, partial [Candidatus Dormibacteraceae bacterium]